ncbi:MAG: endonuclease/exonuclease/phosphatase family protein [Ardenticatenaceae bacterium]|nr:endonuclease/exonuclease/phosphatase family protein [Ardenticatenaceae bacterium]
MKLFTRVLVGLAGLLLLFSVGAWLGFVHWAGDVLALFVPYWAGGTAVLLFIFLILRHRMGGVLAGIALLLNLMPLVGYLPLSRSAVASQPADLRLMVYNIYYRNNDLDAIRAEVDAFDPDVIFLMEYSFAIQSQIEGQFADYPYQLIEPSRMTSGVALFSRVPIIASEVYRFEGTRIPIIEATFDVAGQPVTLVGGHPWPPVDHWANLHALQVADVRRVAEGAERPLIVAGDFNSVPWSFELRQLQAAADVQDTRRGLGRLTTWIGPSLIRLSLDHVFASEELVVQSYAQGQPGGSDHLPIIVDFALAP